MQSRHKLDSYKRGRRDCQRQISAGAFDPLERVFTINPPHGVHRQSWLDGWSDLRAECVHPQLFTATENHQAFVKRTEAVTE